MLCNFEAIYHNEGKMPFLSAYSYEDGTHFSYTDISEVNVWILTDRINIGDRFIFSIGDVGLMVGFIGIMGTLIWFNVYKRKEAKLLSSKSGRKIS